jgi:hypothetical protein
MFALGATVEVYRLMFDGCLAQPVITTTLCLLPLSEKEVEAF